MTERLKLDLDSLTIADIEAIEEAAGCPITWLGNSERPQAKLMRAAAWVVMKRTNPAITWDEVGAIQVSAFNGSEQDPTDAAD